MRPPSLPTELFIRCLEHLGYDFGTLYCCSLVDRRFNRIATKFLYKRVVVSFYMLWPSEATLPEETRHILNQLLPATLSHNAAHVRELVIVGAFDGLPPPSDDSDDVESIVYKALLSWTNIESLRFDSFFAVSSFSSDLVRGALDHVVGLSSLREFRFDWPNVKQGSGHQERLERAQQHILQSVTGLRSLTLDQPNRLVLELLPNWLESSPPLTKLYLISRRGSVPLDLLQSCSPRLSSLQSLAICLSHIFINEGLLTLLSELYELQELRIQCYQPVQTRSLNRGPRLRRLKYLQVVHPLTEMRHEAIGLDTFIRLVISGAPLEELHVQKLTQSHYRLARTYFGPLARHDSLIAHLVVRHAKTLRVLNMEECYVSWKALCAIDQCTHLEQLRVGINGYQLPNVPKLLNGMHVLSQICIRTRNIKQPNLKWDDSHATKFFDDSPSSVQYLQVNLNRWRAVWQLSEAGTAVRAVIRDLSLPFSGQLNILPFR